MRQDPDTDLSIAPTTPKEALTFARRYLPQAKHQAYLAAFEGGTLLRQWAKGLDQKSQEEIMSDSMCIRLDFLCLPYAERLDAAQEERQRFEAWRRRQGMVEDMEHVC